jgi:RNA 2',3'-cyclic 3'-phosphodiesterase
MKRIFIAVKIDPGEVLMEMISSFRISLKEENINWTKSENYHITLAFLGDTEDYIIKSIHKMLRGICKGSGEIDLVLKEAGVFKNFNDPRVLWTGIEPSAMLDKLFESTKAGLNGLGIIMEERSFNPHLTLGRIKRIKDTGMLKSLISRYKSEVIQEQKVSEVILYESLLFHSGPVYKLLGKYPLL